MARQRFTSRSTPGTKLVWRISERAPLGEWVDPRLPTEPAKNKSTAEDDESNVWRRSSFDLLSGLEVNDDPATVPDDLFDEFFRPVEETPPTPKK